MNQLSPVGRVAVYSLWLAGGIGLAGFAAAASFDLGPQILQVIFAGLCLVPVALCAFRVILIRNQAAGVRREADDLHRKKDDAEREAAGVQREAAGAEREAAGAEREATGTLREADGLQREKDGAEREAAGVQREADGADRERDLEELILRNAGEGISLLDNDGRIIYANPAASRMTGYSVDALVGRFIHGRVTNTRENGGAYRNEAKPDGESTQYSQDHDTYWREDGSSFPVEFTKTPIIKGGDGELAGDVIVFKDITERLEVERAKDEFTAVISHELRTPLTSIRGSLGLLESGVLGTLPPKGKSMIEIAIANTDRLVCLIDDILDIERMHSGTIDLVRKPCDASELIANVVAEMEPVATADDVRLETYSDPITLVADTDRINQVLTNLVSNAIKFTEPGGTVALSAEISEEMVQFHISDEGRGIPADMLDSIFARFSQVDASDSRKKSGSGLGLSICNSIVEHHGGQIWVESELGEGSVFTFALPIEAPPAVPADANEMRASAVTDRPDEVVPPLGKTGEPCEVEQYATVDEVKKVVGEVEDDPDLAEVLAATLRRRNIKNASRTPERRRSS